MIKPVASVPQVSRWGVGVVIVSLLFIGWATLRPEPGQATTSHFCLICGDFGGEDAVLNVALFLPLGAGLALCGARGATTFLTGFALSTSIELTQLWLIVGRDATIGDVVMNTTGTALGGLLVRSSTAWIFPSRRVAPLLFLAASFGWLAVQTLASFSFRPVLPHSQYYGQLARKLGNLEVFRGRIDAVMIGPFAIGNTAITTSSQVRVALIQGTPMLALIKPDAPPVGIAPIVRIADQHQNEILLLAQRGVAALFGVRTGASVLRLRSPLFELANALPGSNDPLMRAPVALEASYNGRSARLTSVGHRAGIETDLSVRISMAWMTLVPLTWCVKGTFAETLLGMIWTGFLLIPVGYWSASYVRIRAPGTSRRALIVVGGLVVLLVSGLILMPLATSVGGASPLDLMAALLGLLAGSLVSYLLRLPRPTTSHEANASP